MRTLQQILLAVFLFVPALCQAEDSCLWLNAATASGVLGGAVTATVSRASASLSNTHTPNAKSSTGLASVKLSSGVDDSKCIFLRQPEPAAGELHIDVRTMSEPGEEFAAYAALCGPHASPLKAIGNQAAVCTLDGKAGQFSEQVVGRVRERAFIIRLSISDTSTTRSSLREKARRLAEQVAGNLF
jgi:hypothetical protein